ncbi:MAG: hypothetical protein IT162_18460 [Bryobacterales bacterium]|nr:hypothetical protein [Bryobacterales bacterium]
MNRYFFLALVGVVAGVLLVMYRRAVGGRPIRTEVLALCFWLISTYTLAASGWLDFGPLPPPIMILVTLAFGLTTWVGLSGIGTALVESAGIQALVGFQAFRIAVEIFLWRGYQQGIVPGQMTWHGCNFDVLTGLAAIPVAVWFTGRRTVLWIWNIAGLALLLNIVTVAIVSMPTPLRLFAAEPANRFVATAPYVWLPVFLVQAAWLGHLLVFRWLRRP